MVPKLSITQYLAAYVAALLTLVVGDYFWIGSLMADFYNSRLGSIMLTQPRLGAAGVFYLLYIFGLMFFGVRPGIAAQSWRVTAGHCALFGLIAYGTYDLSNLATLKNWFVDLTVVDMAWGCLISAAAGSAAYAVSRALAPK